MQNKHEISREYIVIHVVYAQFSKNYNKSVNDVTSCIFTMFSYRLMYFHFIYVIVILTWHCDNLFIFFGNSTVKWRFMNIFVCVFQSCESSRISRNSPSRIEVFWYCGQRAFYFLSLRIDVAWSESSRKNRWVWSNFRQYLPLRQKYCHLTT